jgi:hypothetical protein
MRTIYTRVSERLDTLNFEALWPGFHRFDFAIYTSKEVCMKNRTEPWDARYLGNTAIRLGSGYSAIWNVEDDVQNGSLPDLDLLAANLVHEMFHAFQFEHGESRFPNDLKTLTYPNDPVNLSMKAEENEILADAFESEDRNRRTMLLRQFCGLRKAREARIGELIDCEFLTETAEGMAEYAGLRALKALAPQKYRDKTSGYAGILRQCGPLQLDIRRISYFSGALLLAALHDAGIELAHDIAGVQEPVARLLFRKLKPEPAEISPENPKIRALLEESQAGILSEIHKIIKSASGGQTGTFLITGYDPMNMRRVQDLVLCRTFVRLTEEKTKREETFFGETVLKMVKGSLNQAEEYFRKNSTEEPL